MPNFGRTTAQLAADPHADTFEGERAMASPDVAAGSRGESVALAVALVAENARLEQTVSSSLGMED